ncbi:MAG: hydroxyacid dehydrogenase [Micavibrio sp. TMED27]|nr:hydroxyacid dehydrogenase [Micavibrio sp.]OUT91586.1 MAG: hydroxyacid dehydrogenase [Micavibrio sp. TMED27]|tara:strand:- start:11657 stop:12868 length:1212 start_codon:yes stop_codon:yes gene_type:complete
MCSNCNDPSHKPEIKGLDRRKFLVNGAGIAAAAAATPILGAMAQGTEAPFNSEDLNEVTAYGVRSATGAFEKMTIKRRQPRPDDVVIDIHYASICHSDIHTVRGDWGPVKYPMAPGHEMTGRVVAVGSKVTKFKVGDFAGVGCMVNSCMECENCLDDREQNCLNGTTFTYGSDAPDETAGQTQGGYSQKIVVPQHFAVRIPPGVDLAATTPLLCAGITTFSPLQHWDIKRGQTIGVVGLGGLGHMALKLGVSKKADVVVFTTTKNKIADAKNMGAKDAVLWSDEAGMRKYVGALDWIISTVPVAYNMGPFVNLLKLDKTLVNVGAMGPIEGVSGNALVFGRKNISGSLIGGMAETQEVVDYCASRNIKSEIEMITPDQITAAYDRVVGKDVRYRFVIDMKKSA